MCGQNRSRWRAFINVTNNVHSWPVCCGLPRYFRDTQYWAFYKERVVCVDGSHDFVWIACGGDYRIIIFENKSRTTNIRVLTSELASGNNNCIKLYAHTRSFWYGALSSKTELAVSRGADVISLQLKRAKSIFKIILYIRIYIFTALLQGRCMKNSLYKTAPDTENAVIPFRPAPLRRPSSRASVCPQI